jgi:hypothetical protein
MNIRFLVLRYTKYAGVLTFMLAIALVLAGCSDADANTADPDTAESEYTVMFYGVGGSNVDEQLVESLNQVVKAGATADVTFTAEVNFSKSHQIYPGMNGTQRLYLEPGKETLTFEWDPGHELLPLYDPTYLADFIKWSKGKYPAKNYILVLFDHGNIWHPATDNPKDFTSRAVLFDDNFGDKALSAVDLAKGIERSGVHLKMVFYNACLMNMLENLAELDGLVDYTYAASHVTWIPIFDYTKLLTLLKTGDNFEKLIDDYVLYSMENWKKFEGTERPIDIMVTDIAKLKLSFPVIKGIVDILKVDPDFLAITELPIMTDKEHPGVYFYDAAGEDLDDDPLAFYSGDIIQFLEYIDEQIELDLSAEIQSLWDELDKAQATYDQSGDVPIETYYSIDIVNKDQWASKGWSAPGGYQALKFAQATGWHELFKVFNAVPGFEK